MIKVIKTTYDGYFVTNNGRGKINAYEGYDLCPERIKALIDAGNYKKVDSFCREAIQDGII